MAMTLALSLTAGAPTVTNPIAERSADPWVVCWQGRYYYTCTTARNITLWTARRLAELGHAQPQVVYTPPPDTAWSRNLWAPELHRIGERWYIYFCADDGNDANHRMYVLGSDGADPLGPYTLLGKVATPDDHWAIDGTVFEWQGAWYLCWSGWDDPPRRGQRLYVAKMAGPQTLVGPRVEISEPSLEWEKRGHQVNEGPQVLVANGRLHIFYSANPYWLKEYALGRLTLTGDDPLVAANWQKAPWPAFWRGNGVDGPGHGCFFRSPDDTQVWLAYHAHHGERRGDWVPRDFRAQPITFDAGGLPALGEPVPTGLAIRAPSGEPAVE